MYVGHWSYQERQPAPQWTLLLAGLASIATLAGPCSLWSRFDAGLSFGSRHWSSTVQSALDGELRGETGA